MTKIELLFIENLKRERKRAGLTQEQLSELLGKAPKYISSVEMGARFPPPESFQQIAEILKLEPYQLLIDHEKVISVVEVQHIDDFSTYLTERIGAVIAELKSQYLQDRQK